MVKENILGFDVCCSDENELIKEIFKDYVYNNQVVINSINPEIIINNIKRFVPPCIMCCHHFLDFIYINFIHYIVYAFLIKNLKFIFRNIFYIHSLRPFPTVLLCSLYIICPIMLNFVACSICHNGIGYPSPLFMN